MKRFFLWAGVTIALIASSLFIWREPLIFAGMEFALKPDMEFAQSHPHAAPDYARTTAWAARPDMIDPADYVPPGLKKPTAPPQVATLFMHPTTFISKQSWNGALDDPDASQSRDQLVVRGQASAFNLCCDLYAPKYRQATFWSFMDPSTASEVYNFILASR